MSQRNSEGIAGIRVELDWSARLSSMGEDSNGPAGNFKFIIDSIDSKIGLSVVGTNHGVEGPNDNQITNHAEGDIRLYPLILY